MYSSFGNTFFQYCICNVVFWYIAVVKQLCFLCNIQSKCSFLVFSFSISLSLYHLPLFQYINDQSLIREKQVTEELKIDIGKYCAMTVVTVWFVQANLHLRIFSNCNSEQFCFLKQWYNNATVQGLNNDGNSHLLVVTQFFFIYKYYR